MPEITTTRLEDFGWREIKLAAELLNALVEQGTPDDFESDGVHLMFNKHSGCVFLTNSEYQVAMMNGDRLESWYTDFEDGTEGFLEDLPELSLQRLGFSKGEAA